MAETHGQQGFQSDDVRFGTGAGAVAAVIEADDISADVAEAAVTAAAAAAVVTAANAAVLAAGAILTTGIGTNGQTLKMVGTTPTWVT